MIWSSFMLVYWRQHSSTLAYRWGVLEFETEETQRPQFTGVSEYDEIREEMVKVYPTYKRVAKYCISFPIVVAFIIAMLSAMFAFFDSQDELIRTYNNGGPVIYFSYIRSSSLVGRDVSLLSTNDNSTITSSHDSYDSSIHLSVENVRDSSFWGVVLLYPCMYGVLVVVSAKVFNRLPA